MQPSRKYHNYPYLRQLESENNKLYEMRKADIHRFDYNSEDIKQKFIPLALDGIEAMKWKHPVLKNVLPLETVKQMLLDAKAPPPRHSSTELIGRIKTFIQNEVNGNSPPITPTKQEESSPIETTSAEN